MKRGPLPCDFCRSVQGLQCYPTDVPGADWYACANCVALIRIEDWDNLIDRSVAVYTALRSIPVAEQVALRQQVEDRVKAFRTFCLLRV
jgi:hypothetical protein